MTIIIDVSVLLEYYLLLSLAYGHLLEEFHCNNAAPGLVVIKTVLHIENQHRTMGCAWTACYQDNLAYQGMICCKGCGWFLIRYHVKWIYKQLLLLNVKRMSLSKLNVGANSYVRERVYNA